MPAYHVFFIAASAFILGTVFGGLGFSFFQSFFFLALFLSLFFIFSLGKTAALIAAFFFLVGGFYYTLDDYSYYLSKNSLVSISEFEGFVVSEPRRREKDQSVVVKIISVAENKKSLNSRLSVFVDPYPLIHYGDIIKVKGEIIPPPAGSFGHYLAKERIHGTVFYPEMEILDNKANPFFSYLYQFRSNIKSNLSRLFNANQAAFMSGLLLGDRENFSQGFLEKLSFSGTLHLTALSGLHMAIIIFSAFTVFDKIFANRPVKSFSFVFLIIALFVAMTGFKVSAIRASFMAFLASLAGQTGRLYSPRNAIAATALIITLFNPKAPVFDLAFQLSFVATLSIIYFSPVIRSLPFFNQSESFLDWRGILAITIAAQIGVAPISIVNFGNFSFSALPANIAILTIMPLLMISGFLVVATAFIFWPLAVHLSRPVAFLLDYTSVIIEIFYFLRLPFNPNMGITVIALYYLALIWLCYRYNPELNPGLYFKNHPLKT